MDNYPEKILVKKLIDMPRTKMLKPVKIENLLPIDAASEALGIGFSRDTILKLIRRGDWQQGEHYFKMGKAQNAPIKIDIEAVSVWIAQINAS